MKTIHCEICGQLVAVLEKGSKPQSGAVMICRDCWGVSEYRDEPRYPGEMPDFLWEIFL